MPDSPAPIDLLKTHRRLFETEAKLCRCRAERALSIGEKSAHNAAAYAWENAVRQIDVTLRDWA